MVKNLEDIHMFMLFLVMEFDDKESGGFLSFASVNREVLNLSKVLLNLSKFWGVLNLSKFYLNFF